MVGVWTLVDVCIAAEQYYTTDSIRLLSTDASIGGSARQHTSTHSSICRYDRRSAGSVHRYMVPNRAGFAVHVA